MGLNRIYKVVWNKTKGCYVVVSELAKRVGRNKAKAIVMSTAAMAMAVSPMMADATAGNTVGQGVPESVAFGINAVANVKDTVAIGTSAFASAENAVAIGKGSKAKAASAVALGESAHADQARAIAIGKAATNVNGQDTIAIGTETKVQGHTSIVIGKNAKTTNNAEGTVVIGRDAFSEGSGNGGRPNTVVGRGAYTAFGQNGTYRLNAATAFGFQAGAGLRTDPKNGNKLINNETNADNNAEVLVKAGYGLDEKAPADTKAALQGGNVDKNLTFYRKNHINEATALGAEARAIGDQSIAIGGQVVAGDGVVALGGNDTDALRGNKYQVVTDDAVRGTNVNTVDDYNLRYTESTTTVAGQYKNLVGRDMPTAYKSTYGQSGSVVIGMEAHSTTALGTAIGTNSVVRMGAFGATAIGAGSTVQPNAEAAVAIGMGSVANGAYALAGGTASWADYGDIALGYQAKATGKDGAIAMGRATNAQGDSSIMIGGANIASAAAQTTKFQKDNGQVVKKTVTEKINGKPVNREYSFAGTTPTTGTVADAYEVLTGLPMDTAPVDFAKNKNGHASTSLGVHALSKGDLSTAIGAGARSNEIGSVALGVGAHATRQNAVAIGTGSTTDLVGSRQLSVSYDKDGNIVDDNSPNKAYTFNWAGGTNTAEGDVVSFGSSGAERQLKNVAAGRVADDSTDAINGSQLNSISKKLATGWNIAGDPKTKVAGIGTDDQVNFVNGNGTTVTVTKQEEVKNGNTVTTAKGANVKFDVKAADGSITSNANGISVNTDDATIGKTSDGKLKANTGTINTGNDGKVAPNTGDENKLATVNTVVDAVNNAAWKATAGSVDNGTETGKSEEKIKAGDLVTFKAGDNLAIKQDGKNFIYSLKPELTGLTSAGFKNAAGDTTVINGNGMTITPKDTPANQVSLTKDGLDNGGKTIKNVTSGLTNYPAGTPKEGLVDLSKPATGAPAVPDTTAATVGDLRNMGWVVSSDKTTGELTKAYTAQVKNADEVKFVGEGGVTVSGKTENGIRTITVKAEAQEMPEQPVSYTTADGTKVYPVKDANGNVTYHTTPDGKGTEIPKENVIASINGPEGTKAPTTLSNVAGNLDGAKKDTQAPTTEHAPVNTKDAAASNYVNPNNAATVGDVLNAGWNLQNNGTAKDFVKPYDTVNFVNGANTTAVVTTSADGTTSDVTYNVTGLPVTYTDKDGKPVSKIGDKYYPVNEKGQPITPDGKPAVKTNAEGKPVTEDGTVIEPVDTTKPLKTALVNPTPAGDKTNTTDPTALNNVTSGLNKYGDTVDGAQVPGSTPANNGLVDLSKPTDGSEPKVSDNTAATVGDLRNMGWIVSSDKTTGSLDTPYTATVKNANEVKFVGEGTATVSGKTDDNGVRTITVKVDDQAAANNAVSPVVYTDENGDRVYPTGEKDPQGNPIFKKNPNGTGDTVTGPVKTSINGPKGTKTPATLDNVKHNLPTVNDTDKNASDVDGNPIDGKNNTAAPITAADAADLLNPTKDGKPNPKFAGNNAATVSDVLNAGWNLQNNGEARDFVKPYDTVNFVNGANTTAVVTTSEDGTTSNVTYNVTGLPVTFTDKDGKQVSKIGDKYYPVNEKGQPVTPDGKPAVKTNEEGKPVTADGTVIEPIDTKANPLQSNLVNPNVENTKEKPNNQTTSPTQLGNVANGAKTFDPVEDKKLGNDGKWYNAADVLPNGQPKENVQPVAKPENVGKAGLIDFSNSNPNNAATVGDLQNLGWIVSAEGNNYSDQVRNANEVKFVGEGTATVTGKTDDKGVRTITVKVDDQVSTNNAVTPVVYTDKDGNKVYPIKGDDGTVTYHTTPDGKGDNDQVVPNNNVVTSINGPEGTTSPTELKNVKNNIPAVNDADKKVTNPDGTEKGTAGDVNNINKAPLTATEAADLLNPTKDGKPNPNFVGNNAATVSDVLNAGWNLQNNGTAKDFVKPYDTVNFVDGANTTAVVTTNEDGTTSNVTYNVTGLPVTFTDKDGKPVSKIGDKYYPVNEKGQPVTPDGKPAVKTNAEGKPVTEDGTVIEPINTDENPLQTNLVNPNVANSKEAPNNQTTSPTQLGNVANGANTFAPVDGKKMANDGKWYPADQVEPNGQPKTGAAPVDVPANIGKAGLIDFSKSNPNNAATVGDLQNLGWIVSAEGNNYSDQVRNANEVKFVGEGTASVTGKTDENGVRTITVKVDDQVSTNNAQTPVNYTNKDGKKVYPVKDENGNVTYHTTPDGKGAGDETVPAGDVITSLNGPEGTTAPTTLNNVKNNIPAVNDADKKVTNPDGTEKGTAGDVNNINKAPLTATEAADLLNPTKDGKPNPNFVGNNAATVSDVLNAGWNLQNNGTAKDFVKPYDTVNFVDGANTTAVVTTNEDGTTSNVTYNVTGLPVTFTDKDGKPVSKIGDKYYPVNEKGQPVTPDGKPAVKTNAEGKPVTEDGTVIEPIDTAKDPLKSNMVNPNVANTADAPNNQTTTPTQLGNVANGAETFKPADDLKLANDGKWYNAADVKPNGAPKTAKENNGKAPTPVANPLFTKNKAGDVLEKGNDGNWYKASDLEKGEPKPNAEEQFPEEKPENADKAGLINFENSNPNNAATVGDLQNMGFVVSAKDNGYTEQMRNANKVEFKGDNGVQVTGKTLADGTREITVALKEGRVTNNVIITDADGKEVKAVRGEDGKIYKKDPKTGKAMKEEFPIKPTDTVRNDGDGYVTGNSVATAIQKSGWNIGIGSTDKAFSEEAKTYERVNPKDNVKYVNGANTTVSMVVDAAEDKDGATVTTTYVKVDVNRDLHIDSVTTGGPAKDKAGNPLKQVNGEYYPENALVNDGKVYPAGTVMIDGKPYPAGSAKDPKTKTVLKDGKPAPEAQPLRATPKDQLADGKDGAMTVKDAKGNDGVSATAKDGKGTLTLKDAGKDGKDASQVDISTAKAPADLENTPKDAVRANDGNWYAPADVTVEVKDGKTVVTPKAGKTPIPNAPTMDRIQYTGTDGKPRNVATMDDGLRFVGDDGQTISKPLNSTMEFTGGNRENGKPVAKADTTTGNIGVFHDNGKLSIQLAKDLDKLNSANFESKTDKAGNPLKVVDGKYYPEKAVVKEGKVYPEGTVIIDNKPYPAGTTKDAAGKVVNNGKPATEATPINPIDSKQVQDGPTSRLTGTGLTFNTPTPKDENGNPLVLVDGKYYKADNLENGKPKADAKAEPVKPAQSTAFTPDGLVVTPETAKVRDANGNPVLDKDGREVVDPTKVVSFGSPTIAVDPKTGKPMVDPKTGEPVMKSGISAGGQVMANVAPGVLDTDAVNVSQLKGVSNMVMNVNNRVNRLGAQAAAMAGLRHLQYDPLEPTTIMAGVGAYKGEAALALGIAHYKNESTLFHAGASIGSRGDELMANAGVSWKFGARADETAVKDTFRQGPISSSYTLQDKVSALEAQNQVQKDEINNLKAQLAEVLQYVKKG